MKPTSQERFFEAATKLCEILISILQSETAANFARRLTTLSKSRWVPSSGAGDVNTIAFLLNKSSRTVEDTVRDRDMTRIKTGTEWIYPLQELTSKSPIQTIPGKKPRIQKPRGKRR